MSLIFISYKITIKNIQLPTHISGASLIVFHFISVSSIFTSRARTETGVIISCLTSFKMVSPWGRTTASGVTFSATSLGYVKRSQLKEAIIRSSRGLTSYFILWMLSTFFFHNTMIRHPHFIIFICSLIWIIKTIKCAQEKLKKCNKTHMI